MDKHAKYSINLDNKFGYLKLVDIPKMVEGCRDQWFNQTLCTVNGCVVRLGIVQGEFHWHRHKNEDEMFLVLEGQLMVDLENDTVTLGRHCAYTVPRGITHRTRAPERTVILMVEGAGVSPTGD